jgi:hypothetical protein
MASIEKTTRCALCGNLLGGSDAIVATSPFIANKADRLWQFSNAAMHRTCFVGWEDRSEFIERFNAAQKVSVNRERHWMLPDGAILSDLELRDNWRRVTPGMTLEDAAQITGFGFNLDSHDTSGGVVYSTALPLYLVLDPASARVVQKHDVWRVEEWDASVASGGVHEVEQPTGRTAVRELVANDGRQVVIDEVRPGDALVIPFDGEDYCAVIWACDGSLDLDARCKVLSSLIVTGCRYIVCAGANCERWHDEADETWVMQDIQSDADHKLPFIQTESHSHEWPSEVVSWALGQATCDGRPLTKFVVIVAGEAPAVLSESLAELFRWELQSPGSIVRSPSA